MVSRLCSSIRVSVATFSNLISPLVVGVCDSWLDWRTRVEGAIGFQQIYQTDALWYGTEAGDRTWDGRVCATAIWRWTWNFLRCAAAGTNPMVYTFPPALGPCPTMRRGAAAGCGRPKHDSSAIRLPCFTSYQLSMPAVCGPRYADRRPRLLPQRPHLSPSSCTQPPTIPGLRRLVLMA